MERIEARRSAPDLAETLIAISRRCMKVTPGPGFTFVLTFPDAWEVRAQHGGDTFRLLGFLDGSRLVLTGGFAKKTEKTPPREIALAEKRKQDYMNRRHEHERPN